MANLSKVIGNIKYNHVIDGIILDKRWSPFISSGNRIIPQITSYFKPGVGYGGSCFPKDIQAINSFGKKLGLSMSITSSVMKVNSNQVALNLEFLETEIGDFRGKRVLLLGLAFKPGTDDLRESTSLKILEYLLSKNVKVYIHDPVAMKKAKEIYSNFDSIVTVESWEKSIPDVELIIIGTNWDDYKRLINLDLEGKLWGKVIFDSKGMFDVGSLTNSNYQTVGYATNS
jgi:UDPglucose 6-dehydrogenase/GDP-mannose 6-dehydrogenase